MKSVLVIDDSRATADTLVRILKALDCPARAAYGSSAGISILREETPDLVFLDINMPGVSGFEILKFMSREPRLAGVPVFIVSSEDQPETRAQALRQGARGFLTKPITVEALDEVLKSQKPR
ncbi:MAG: response regulator [Anaerolineales bacterium]|jgi:twitching motility two-component system response regulator PilH|nr:response regulator [Anaerolineales bacterium]